MSEFAKYESAEDTKLFSMFNVQVNDKGHDLWHFRKVGKAKANGHRTAAEQAAAVEALAAFYAPYVEASKADHKAEFPSPFDKEIA